VSAAHAFLLVFLLFRPDHDHAAEDGEVRARSCEAAEAWVRAGLQPGQDVLITGCGPVAETLTTETRR
jgi:hypothetical protein